MLKYSSDNSSGLLVEFMETVLCKYRHTKPRLSAYSKRILVSQIIGEDGAAFGIVTKDGKNLVCLTYCGQDRDNFFKICAKEGIRL